MNWKKYYKTEFKRNKEFIEKESKKSWNYLDVSKPRNILLSEGVLSFPHTKISESIMPLLKTIKSIYLTEKYSVLAIGVTHYRGKGYLKKEFSLDNFIAVADVYSRVNNLPKLKIKKIFYSPMIKNKTSKNINKYIIKIKKDLNKLRIATSKDSVIVTTGDLSHYGDFYSFYDYKKSFKKNIVKEINKSLNLVYEKRDYFAFFNNSLKIKNDQIVPAIIISLIKGKCKVNVFSVKFTDYSELSHKNEFAKVASIFYGISPNK